MDIAAFVLAAAFSVVTSGPTIAGTPQELLLGDQIAGALACCALWWRRRLPVALAVALIPVGVFSHFISGPQLVAVFTLAVHRPFRTVAVVVAGTLATLPLSEFVRPDPELSSAGNFILGTLLIVTPVGWGMFVRSRRQLIASLKERAERAEEEAARRAQEAQRAARDAIAREMHDVLAHRLSLLSVHAGALEFRPDAPPADIARAAGVIRSSAHQALEDLREVIGVLRAAPNGGDGTPQPTLRDVERLINESRAAGMAVTFDRQTPDAEPPATIGRTAYRIVQEGLTNARKHAPGSAAGVTLEGAPGTGLTVSVHSAFGDSRAGQPPPPPPGTVADDSTAPPGAGTGLIGLAERTAVVGGRLQHGPADGQFRLTAWLPWAP